MFGHGTHYAERGPEVVHGEEAGQNKPDDLDFSHENKSRRCWGMHVAAGFMPVFKYQQKNSLMVLEHGHKARGYVSAEEVSKNTSRATADSCNVTAPSVKEIIMRYYFPKPL